MRRSVLFLVLALAACGSDRVRAPGTSTRVFNPNAGDASTNVDGSSSDGGVFDAGVGFDGGPSIDAGFIDGGGTLDAGFADAGFADAGFHDAGTPDSGPPPGEVALTFTGCSADFSHDLIVSYNGSIAIGSVTGGGGILTSSLQFDLNGTGTKSLSSRHRIDTGEVVNLVIQTTWTNISNDVPDPIGGTLIVREYAASAGRVDVTFVGVTLANVQTGAICRIDGDVRSTRIGR